MKKQFLVDATGALVVSVVALTIMFTVFAQEPPSLPPDNKAAILEIQLRMEKTKSQYDQLYQQFLASPSVKQLQDQFNKDLAALTTAQVAACKAAKADCEKDWTLNPSTLKFEPRPKPTPEAKK